VELLSAESGFQFPGDMDDESVRWKSSNCGFEEVIAGERERKSSSAFFFSHCDDGRDTNEDETMCSLCSRGREG
jgi:hypothetical protein